MTVVDDMQATASVIHHACSEMGVQTVLGTQQGFINVSADMLMSDLLALLPRTQEVLVLLETIAITDAVIERCRELKQQGFTLALDDFVFDESYRPLLALVDMEDHAPPVYMGKIPGKTQPTYVMDARLSHVLSQAGWLQGRASPR